MQSFRSRSKVTRHKIEDFSTDEHVKPETTLSDLAEFENDLSDRQGTVTAGNSSGINDGAAAIILASGSAVKRRGLKPQARFSPGGHRCRSGRMGIGPVPATRLASTACGYRGQRSRRHRSKRSLCSTGLRGVRALGFDPAKVNPNGSGISWGIRWRDGRHHSDQIVHQLERTVVATAWRPCASGEGKESRQ